MQNIFKPFAILSTVIVSLIYFSTAFLEIDNANRLGCETPIIDENGTIHNCSLSNNDFYHLNNTETSFGISILSVSMLVPLVGIAIIGIVFFSFIRRKK
jgi:hypothetical protein